MRILVFSAHPDDAEFGMGGTLIQLGKLHEVSLVVMTDGAAGSFGTPEVRKKEQEKAAALVGATLSWGGIPDCHLDYTREQALKVAQIIREKKPDIIFSPHWDQQGSIHDGKAHPDHRAMGLLVRDAARFARFRIDALQGEKHACQHIFWYMVPDHRTPKILVPIDDFLEEFKTLMKAHESQLQIKKGKVEEYLLYVRKIAAQNHGNIEHGEVFDCDVPVPITAQCLFK
jgi:N-acetylglucosamine malate deacetylase 1